MLSAVTLLLSLLEQALPLIGVGASSASLIDSIIAGLIQIMPFVVTEAQNLAGPVQGIIAALSNHGAVTQPQLATLLTLKAQADAAFEDAALAAGAAPDPSP